MKIRKNLFAAAVLLAATMLFSGCSKSLLNIGAASDGSQQSALSQQETKEQTEAPTQSTSAEPQPQTTEETEPPQTDDPTTVDSGELTFGDTFVFDGLEITLDENYSFVTLENRFSDLNGADVVKVPISVHNISGETKGLNMYYYKFFGSKGLQLDNVTAYFDNEIGWSGKARNGATIEAYMYFLYDGDGDYYVSFQRFIEDPTEVRLPITK